MLKNLLITILLFTTSIALAQMDFEQSLDSLQTLDDVNIYFKKNKKVKGKVIVFNEEKHKTRMAEDIFKMGVGSKRTFGDNPQKTYYKIIDKYEVPYFRASYILLDENKKSRDEIISIKNTIISKFNNGYRFQDLAKQYSMDNTSTRGGDTGWFTDGDLHPDFETSVKDNSSAIGDLYFLEIPSKKEYYVVLKTHDKKIIEEAKVLKITEPRK